MKRADRAPRPRRRYRRKDSLHGIVWRRDGWVFAATLADLWHGRQPSAPDAQTHPDFEDT